MQDDLTTLAQAVGSICDRAARITLSSPDRTTPNFFNWAARQPKLNQLLAVHAIGAFVYSAFAYLEKDA